MDEQTNLLREIRDLLRLMAEPQLAERDRKGREAILAIVGRSEKRQKAVLLVDGIRTRAQIQKELGWDDGNMSRLFSALKDAGVCDVQNGIPTLRVSISAAMFNGGATK